MNKCATFCYGGDYREEGEIVDIEAGEWHRVNLVDGGHEVGFFDGKVDKASAAIGGKVLGGDSELSVHIFEDFKLYFEKLDRCAEECDFGVCDKSNGNKRHGLDRVFGKMVVYVGIDA